MKSLISDMITGGSVFDSDMNNWIVKHQCPNKECRVTGTMFLNKGGLFKKELPPMENQLVMVTCQGCHLVYHVRMHYVNQNLIKKTIIPKVTMAQVRLNQNYNPNYICVNNKKPTRDEIDHLYKFEMLYKCPSCDRYPKYKIFVNAPYIVNSPYIIANVTTIEKCDHDDCNAEFYIMLDPIKENGSGVFESVGELD